MARQGGRAQGRRGARGSRGHERPLGRGGQQPLQPADRPRAVAHDPRRAGRARPNPSGEPADGRSRSAAHTDALDTYIDKLIEHAAAERNASTNAPATARSLTDSETDTDRFFERQATTPPRGVARQTIAAGTASLTITETPARSRRQLRIRGPRRLTRARENESPPPAPRHARPSGTFAGRPLVLAGCATLLAAGASQVLPGRAAGAGPIVLPWPQCAPLCRHAPAHGPRITAIYLATQRTRSRAIVTLDAFAADVPGGSVTGRLCYEAHHNPTEPGCVVIATAQGRRVGAGVWWLRFHTPVHERYQISNSDSHALVTSYTGSASPSPSARRQSRAPAKAPSISPADRSEALGADPGRAAPPRSRPPAGPG